jgi:sulfur-oxidizing protein SoxX
MLRNAALIAAAMAISVPSMAQELIVDGDRISAPLTSQPGDAVRGRAIVVDRQKGLCLLCHTGPFAEQKFQGNLAPDLSGVGSRPDSGQLRLRLVDSLKINPQSIMPSYYRADGLHRVGTNWRGKTILSAQDIEDVIAMLASLSEADAGGVRK